MSYGDLSHAISALLVNRAFYEASVKTIDSFVGIAGPDKSRLHLLDNPSVGRPLIFVNNRTTSYNYQKARIVGFEMCSPPCTVSFMNNGSEIMPFIKNGPGYIIFGSKKVMLCDSHSIEEATNATFFAEFNYSNCIITDKLFAAFNKTITAIKLDNINYIQNEILHIRDETITMDRFTARHRPNEYKYIDMISRKYIYDGELHNFTILDRIKQLK